MDSRGLDATVAATVLSVMAPSLLFGSFGAGFLAERLPGRYLIAAGQVILATSMLLTLFLDFAWQAYIYAVMLGTTMGLLTTSAGVIWPTYYGRKHLGSIWGMVTTSVVALSALGPWPFGVIFEVTGTYTMAVATFMVLPALGTIAALMAYPPRRNRA